MEKSKKNTTMLIIITIAVFLVAVLGATFAYFATEREVGSAINANVGTAGKSYQFTAASTDKIEMNIAFNEMSQANISTNVLKSDNAVIDVSLASPNNNIYTKCTYDIVWVWDDGDMYTEPDVELPYTHTDSKVYNYEFSVSVDGEPETDLSKFSKTDKKVTLQSGFTIESYSTEATTKKHEIKASVYNLPINQTKLFGKNFKAHVTIDNLNCNMSSPKLLATYIKNDVYTGTNPNGTAGLSFHTSDTTSPNYLASGAADNTYRYAGGYSYPKASEGYDNLTKIMTYVGNNYYALAYDETKTKYGVDDAVAKAKNDGYLEEAVNNFVCFLGDDCSDENNLYRIISVNNDNKTKVIKATSLGRMAWDDTTDGTYSDVWENASLQKYLNGEYLTKLGDKENKIEITTWNVGKVSYDDRNNKNAKAFMDIEVKSIPKVGRKIGLMYASEYGFAALPEYWSKTLYNYASPGIGNDWMITYFSEWTISPILPINKPGNTINYGAFYVGSDYDYLSNYNVFKGWHVLPSFNLIPNIKIINANTENVGSKANPMIIN